MTTPPLLRSALYLPASNARAVEKARTLPCDAVILDLEDAVAPDDKEAARAAAAEAVRLGGFGRRLRVIRVNALSTPWGRDDLAAAVLAGPDAVLVPKIEDAADVLAYGAALAGAPEATRLWLMIETARSLLALTEIATAKCPRLQALVLGPNDLGRELGARMTPGREPFFTAFSLTLAAARSASLLALDGPFGRIDDLAGLETECRQSRDFGFDGKTLIHPSHIATCNAGFSPEPQEIRSAQAIVEAFKRPENAGKGAIRVEGRMAERLHLALAERLLAAADAVAAAEAASPYPP